MKKKKEFSLQRSNSIFGILLLLPSIIFVSAFFAWPILYSVYLSTTNINLFLPSIVQKFVGFGNYIALFKDVDFIDSIKISSIYVFSATAGKLLFGFLLALLFQQKIRGFGFFRSLMIIPMMITPICAGLIWKFMFNPGFGLINYLTGFLHIPAIGWHAEVSTALMSVVIVDLWMMIPFVITVTMSGLASLPVEVYEAADIDGASWWTKLNKITIPLMKPIITIMVLINLIDGFKVFDNVWIMTKGGPAHATELFTIFAYKQGIKEGKLGYGAAASLIVLVIILIITILFIRFSKAEQE